MPPTISDHSTTAAPAEQKSAADLKQEYDQLLEEYDRLTHEVDAQIRRMRGRRVLKWQAILDRILHRKQSAA